MAHRVGKRGQVVGQLPAEVHLEGRALPLRDGRRRGVGFGRLGGGRVAENESRGFVFRRRVEVG